jgi:lysophospholipase L1-like esterase
VTPENISIAAELGAKVERLPRLIDRLLDAQKELPKTLFIFFTGNDLCSSNMNTITGSESFGDSLWEGLQYLVRNGNPSAQGTTVYIPHVLSFSQWITKDSLLDHRVSSGKGMTCRELRKSGFSFKKPDGVQDLPIENIGVVFGSYLTNQCPTLFNHETLALSQVSFFSNFNAKKRQNEIVKIKEEFLSTLATRVRSYRDQTDAVVKRANEWSTKTMPHKKIRFQVIKETGQLDFEGDDLADDCFHLNLNGQVKVANAILKGLSLQLER